MHLVEFFFDKYIFIGNSIIASIVFEKNGYSVLLNALRSIYFKLKYSLM